MLAVKILAHPLFAGIETHDVDSDCLSVILIAHVHEPRGYKNPSQLQCATTERFSVEEFNEIYQGIVAAGFYIQRVYFNELDFILDYTQFPSQFQNCMIYTLARNGLGDNKKTVIPALCELVGLPYSCSASLSCALCRNKYHFSTLLRAHGISVPESWLYTTTHGWENGSPPNGTQIICKPCAESASQGVSSAGVVIVPDEQWTPAGGKDCLVQEYIDGAECEVPVFKLKDQILVMDPVGIDLHGQKVLDEDMSMLNNYGFYPLSNTQKPNVIEHIKSLAEDAFRLLQMDIYGRVDFRIDKQGKAYIFDISTTPYTTHHSSFAFAFEKKELPYSDIYRAIIAAALERWALLN